MKIYKKTYLFIISFLIIISGCKEHSSKLKKPASHPRISVNNQIPEELQNYIEYEEIKEN
ncbi:MAG: hypothetical protein EOP34_10405 [Rickettsiales bacterium]|nr:MAG: hypothetical protein EOP34_10405 [Rickettsiales bacterium]